MAKYYKITRRREKEFIKVYDKIPKDYPEAFRKSTLVACNKNIVRYHGRNSYNHCEIRTVQCLMTQENLDIMIKFQGAEITQEEYQNAVSTINNTINIFKPFYESI